MKKRLIILLLSLMLALAMGTSTVHCQQQDAEPEWKPNSIIRAKVLGIQEVEETGSYFDASPAKRNIVSVKLLTGPFKGQELQVSHVEINHPGYNIAVNQGDEVVLYVETEGDSISEAYITDHARDKTALYLAILFLLLLILVGGLKGLKAAIALSITGGGIFFILLPMLLKGHNPILLTVVLSAVVTTLTLVILGGISVKTFAAIVGTTGGVMVAGLLAYVFGTAAKLTGFSSEEMHMLLYIPQNISFDYQGILFAGMIIGALGAVMDVAMSVASAIEEIKRVNPLLRAGSLIRSGMNVGRDTMGTMANTLILAYTGGAIPLLLVFLAYDTPFLKIINLDLIATEVISALVGSVGLVLAIPITSITAGLLLGLKAKRT